MTGQVATRFMPQDLGDPLSELGLPPALARGPAPAPWDGSPAERDRLLGGMETHGVVRVVFLSADVHTSWAVELRRDGVPPDTPPLAVEMVTPERHVREPRRAPRRAGGGVTALRPGWAAPTRTVRGSPSPATASFSSRSRPSVCAASGGSWNRYAARPAALSSAPHGARFAASPWLRLAPDSD